MTRETFIKLRDSGKLFQYCIERFGLEDVILHWWDRSTKKYDNEYLKAYEQFF